MKKLVIDGNAVYEIDEKCMQKKREKENKGRKEIARIKKAEINKAQIN